MPKTDDKPQPNKPLPFKVDKEKFDKVLGKLLKFEPRKPARKAELDRKQHLP